MSSTLGVVLIVAGALMLVSLIAIRWLQGGGTTTTHIQYVEVEYLGEDGNVKSIEGWVNYIHHMRHTVALDWYEDDRTEIGAKRLIEIERKDWEEIEKGGPTPY